MPAPRAIRRGPKRPFPPAVVCAAALCLAAVSPAAAGVVVTLDSATLNDVLASVAVREVEVPLTAERTVRVLLEDLRILGFEPGSGRQGSILTSVLLRVPALGISARVSPRLSLAVVRAGDANMLELRFEEVRLALPLKSLDIAGFLPPMRFPAENLFQLPGASGDVEIRSRLDDVRMREGGLIFELSLIVQPPVPSAVEPGAR